MMKDENGKMKGRKSCNHQKEAGSDFLGEQGKALPFIFHLSSFRF
jgi:hypothetical protein